MILAPLLLAALPNFIVVTCDDCTKLDLQILRGGLAPTLTSRIIAPGVEFSNAFVTQALCGPSRASFLTGKYPHSHGVHGNLDLLNFDESDTVATRLQSAGYHTIHVGKYINGYGDAGDYVPAGWSDWNGHLKPTLSVYDFDMNRNGVITHYPTQYKDDVVGDIAAAAVTAGLATGKPLFLNVAPMAPHVEDSTIFATLVDGYQPKDQWLWYARPNPADATLKAPQWSYILNTLLFYPGYLPSFNEPDISDKPTFLQGPLMDAQDKVRNDGQYRLRLLTLLTVDDIVAKIAVALGPEALSNTVWILTGDNGFSNGQHRRSQKLTPYEECIRVPLFIALPGVAPRVETRMALNNDLNPTILDIAGVTPSSTVEGRSLLPLLQNQSVVWRQRFLVEHWQSSDPVEGLDIPTFAALRTAPTNSYPQRLFVDYITGERERYVLAADPYEIASSLPNATELTALTSQLAALKSCSGAACILAEN